MAVTTIYKASNNQKASKDHYTQPSQFIHRSMCSQGFRAVSAIIKSPKFSCQLANRQSCHSQDINPYMPNPNPLEFIELVKRFFLSSSKWHLVPKNRDITTLETLREVLGRLSPFTDALSGEKHVTALPLM